MPSVGGVWMVDLLNTHFKRSGSGSDRFVGDSGNKLKYGNYTPIPTSDLMSTQHHSTMVSHSKVL